jgi:hypothetical protein
MGGSLILNLALKVTSGALLGLVLGGPIGFAFEFWNPQTGRRDGAPTWMLFIPLGLILGATVAAIYTAGLAFMSRTLCACIGIIASASFATGGFLRGGSLAFLIAAITVAVTAIAWFWW